MTGSALAVDGLSKTYPGTQALRGVSFEIPRGTVHGLLGTNGSGKSTLIQVLAGLVDADAGGTIEICGERMDATDMTPDRAWSQGLRFVHQHSSAFAALSVAENLALGHGFVCGFGRRIRWREQRRRAAELIERFHIGARPDTLVQDLSPSRQAMVQIARAVQDVDGQKGGLLVLDEPTASLPAPEVELLLGLLRQCAAAGQTILFVSHRLHEVLDVADAVTVLRDGALVETIEREELSHDRLVSAIVGRSLNRLFPEPVARKSGDVVLEVDELNAGPLRDVSLCVRRGEVVGLAGLEGSGRSTLLDAIFGVATVDSGRIAVDGAQLALGDPRASMAAGIALVPSDRATDAVFPDLSVGENLAMADVRTYWRHMRLQHRRERADGVALRERYGIRAASIDAPISTLSGGNQQKVILARWLKRKPRVLLLDEPTQGIDIGSRADIYRIVKDAVADGAGAVVVSSDEGELAGLCDRVLVMANGRITAELECEDLDAKAIEELTLAKRSAA
jgi:ribose transport system ATP-binding protein